VAARGAQVKHSPRLGVLVAPLLQRLFVGAFDSLQSTSAAWDYLLVLGPARP
jgi:hypothetical protein